MAAILFRPQCVNPNLGLSIPLIRPKWRRHRRINVQDIFSYANTSEVCYDFTLVFHVVSVMVNWLCYGRSILHRTDDRGSFWYKDAVSSSGIGIPVPCTRKDGFIFEVKQGRGGLSMKMSSYQYMIPMLKIRRSHDRLIIINMRIPYQGKTVFILRQGPAGPRFNVR